MAATPRVALFRRPSRDEIGKHVLSRGLHALAVASVGFAKPSGCDQRFDQRDLVDLDAEQSRPGFRRARLRVSRWRAAMRRASVRRSSMATGPHRVRERLFKPLPEEAHQPLDLFLRCLRRDSQDSG